MTYVQKDIPGFKIGDTVVIRNTGSRLGLPTGGSLETGDEKTIKSMDGRDCWFYKGDSQLHYKYYVIFTDNTCAGARSVEEMKSFMVIPEKKFKVGDKVKVCSYQEDKKGRGYLSRWSDVERIYGFGGRTITLTGETKELRGITYYMSNLDSGLSGIAEYALTKIEDKQENESKSTTKNNTITMQKKERIIVTGTPILKKAFVEQLTEEKIIDSHLPEAITNVDKSLLTHSSEKVVGWVIDVTKEDGQIYNLPQDWDKAIEAIKKAYNTIIKIGGYTAERVGKGQVKFGCQTITTQEIDVMIHMVSKPINMKAAIGDTVINLDLLNKLKELAK